MLSAECIATPSPIPSSRKPTVVIAVARPHGGGLMGIMKGIGVAATLRSEAGLSHHWMAGYARSEDMARAAIIHHLVQNHRKEGERLEVWSPTPIDALQWVAAARRRNGKSKSGNRFKGFDVFDPVEAAMQRGEWSLRTFDPKQMVIDYGNAPGAAKLALQVASDRASDFTAHYKEHPDWWMLQVGHTDNPMAERHGRV